MDGASRAFATPITIELGGETFEVRPKIAAYFGEIEAHLLGKRENPMLVARNNLALFADLPGSQEKILEIAMAETCRMKTVTRREIGEWLDSMDGTAFWAWLQIRHNDENYDPEKPSVSATRVTHAYVKTKMYEEYEAALEKLTEEGLAKDEAERRAEEDLIARTHAALNRPSGEDELGFTTGPPPTEEAGPTSQSPGDDGSGD